MPGIALTLFLGLCWALGQLFRDLTAWTAFLFYIPSPALAGMALMATGWAIWRRKRLPPWARFGPPLLAAAALGASWGENPRFLFRASTLDLAPNGRAVRLVHWNVCRGCLGWNEAVTALQAWDADLLVLSEYPKRMDVRATAAALGPTYQGRRFGTLALFARGAKTGVESLLNEYELEVHRITWERTGTAEPVRLRILAVDVVASPRIPRDPQLLRIQQSIARETPDLVLGDFNAPRRSWRLQRLPDGYHDAYDLAGAGWAGTWPSPFPLWAIDHVIAGPRIRVRSYRLPFSWRSDHRAQLVELEVRDTPPSTPRAGSGP